MAVRVDEPLLNAALFGSWRLRRLTQDSPILASVCKKYAEAPEETLDLLLTPHRDASPAELARALREQLSDGRAESQVFYNDSYVVGRFNFSQLLRVLLPLTNWHSQYFW